MWIVTRAGNTVRELSILERSMIVSYAQSNLRGHDQECAARMLRTIRTDGLWIGCDCASPMPLMNVALRDTGTLVLRNNPNGAAHADNCPLIKQEHDQENDSSTSSRAVDRIAPDGHIALHSEFSAESAGKPQQISRSSASKNSPQKKKLLSLLLSVIESAGFHEYDPAHDKTVADQFQRLREALWRYHLGPGVPAQSFTDTRIDKRRIAGMAARLRATSAFGSHRSYALMVDVVSGISGRNINLLPDGSLGFFGHVELWGSASGPKLAMATLTAQSASSRFYELGHIALIPVLSSKTFMPVQSDEERESLKAVIGIIDWMHHKHKARITIRRQLFSSLGLLDLQGRGRQLTIDLTAGHPVGASPPSPSFLSIGECGGDIERLKRRIARYFLDDGE